MKKSILLFFLLTLFSCQTQQENATQHFTEIVISTSQALNNAKYSNFIDNYEFVPLETGKDFLVGRIDKIKTTARYIYILDRFSAKAVFQFDRKGKFIQKIGGVGSGPGEYEFPMDFTIDEQKQEIIINNMGVSLNFYDISGKYLKKKDLGEFSISEVEVLPKSNFAFIGGGKEDNLIIVDNQLKRKKSFFPFTIREFNTSIIQPLQKINDFTILYRKDFIDTIYNIANQKPVPYCVINYQEKTAPMKQLLKEVESTKKFPNNLEKYCRTSGYFEQNDFVMLFFIYQNNPFISIYNKKTKNTHTIRYNSATNDVGIDKSAFVVGTDKLTGTFIWKIEPQSFLKGIEEYKSQYVNQSTYQKAITFAKNIKEDDNPILMFTKLK